MSNQNIYDNEKFFEEYYALRQTDDSFNDLLEQPAMKERLPDLSGKTVLDLGCGYGRNCIDFVNRGAKRVVGVDISRKMLETALRESAHENIEYLNISMADIDKLDEKFDFIYSSLAFHYIEDFEKLIADIRGLLNPGGCLLFSQEHPIVTATLDGNGHFNRNEQGERISYTFSNYSQSGKRVTEWFVDGMIIYHRTLGEIITTLARAGFVIEEVNEPAPAAWALEKRPSLVREFIKPSFLIVKAKIQ